MKEEANAAKESLKQEQEYLMEEMGFTEDEINNVTTKVNKYANALAELPTDVTTHAHFIYDDFGQSHAIGSAYIPYDNYPALLHRGEKVLTATEARQDNSSIDISAMEDSIIAAIRSGMEGATVRSYLNGKDITDEVSRQNISDIKARRFRG